jgi:hypothetical protein
MISVTPSRKHKGVQLLAKIMVRNLRLKLAIYRSNHVYQPVIYPGDQQR